MTENTANKRTIIFLDVDFVLNDTESTAMFGKYTGVDDDKIELLKEIADILDAEIVLSSTWREFWKPNLDMSKAAKGKYGRGRYLNRKLAEHGLTITDNTPVLEWWLRAKEVATWLRSHPDVTRFIILDDEDFRWSMYELDKHWVDTYEQGAVGYDGGLKPKHVDYIRENIAIFEKDASP